MKNKYNVSKNMSVEGGISIKNAKPISIIHRKKITYFLTEKLNSQLTTWLLNLP